MDKKIFNSQYIFLKNSNKSSWTNSKDQTRKISVVSKIINLTEKKNILVLGCGDGEISFWLESLGHKVVGIDFSDEAIKWANEKKSKKGSRVDFINHDILSKEHLESQFDLIIDDYLCHCIIGNDRISMWNFVKAHLHEKRFFLHMSCCLPKSFQIPEFLKSTIDTNTGLQIIDGTHGRYFGNPQNIISEIEANQFNLVSQLIENNSDSFPVLAALFAKCE